MKGAIFIIYRGTVIQHDFSEIKTITPFSRITTPIVQREMSH